MKPNYYYAHAAALLLFGIFIPALVLLFTSGTPVTASENGDTKVSFREDVFPIIEEHCLPCHLREERNMSRLFMDDYESLLKGGFNGTPIKPGNAEESLLIKKTGPEPPFGERMPMRSQRYLTDEEMAILVQWIDQGAEDN